MHCLFVVWSSHKSFSFCISTSPPQRSDFSVFDAVVATELCKVIAVEWRSVVSFECFFTRRTQISPLILDVTTNRYFIVQWGTPNIYFEKITSIL